MDLPTTIEQVSSLNGGITHAGYQQVAATRDVTGTSFPNGAMHFRWSTAPTHYWIPAKSFFRMRIALTDAGGNALEASDDLAPNMGLCANLFQSAEVRLQGKTVCRVSDFLPQVDSLSTRMSKSKAWLDGAGATTNLWQPSIAERQSVMCNGTALNEKTIVSTTDGDNLGFDGTTQVAIAADTGVITFSVVLPTVSDVFQVGDVLQIVTAAGVTLRYVVENAAAATVTCSSAKSNSLAAEVPTSITRIRTISPDTARNVQNIELIWNPPLSLLRKVARIPTGQWEIVLTPQASSAYQKYGIESSGADKTAGTDFSLSVTDMFYYAHVVEGERYSDSSYILDLDNVSCQVQQIDTASFGQKDFTVSPSTHALTVAYQDSRVGTNSLVSSSKFKSYNVAVSADTDLALNRLFVNFNGRNMPQPDADPEFNTTTDRTAQRWAETQIVTGALMDAGGPETIQDYHDRGSYYHFQTPQDKGSRATRVLVHQGFTGGTDVTNMRVLLFSHHKALLHVQVADGMVTKVEVSDM